MRSTRTRRRSHHETPLTAAELGAYCAGSRLRETVTLGLDRLAPSPVEVLANLTETETRTLQMATPARWWRWFWKGWAAGAGEHR